MARQPAETTPLLHGSTSHDARFAAPPPAGAQPIAATSTAARFAAILGPANRILLAGFLMSFTLGITQVPILYVFRLMECDVFYTHNPPYSGPWAERCHRREINAGTAQQVSILGMSTSFSGVFNLFVCGYFIKLWGPRWAYVSQTSLLGIRVSTQILAVTIGGRTGEVVFQACQAIGTIGGPRGYQLVLNTSVAEVVAPRDRTAVFGRLQGAIMLGTAFGFLLGGVLGDIYGIRRPFEVAFFLYVISTVYGAIFMPAKTASGNKAADKARKGGIAAFFAPIRVIVPHRYRLESGKVITNYGLIFLAGGLFLGVFASGYCPTLLQLYGTASFNWGTTENGYLMFGNSLIRGMFLIVIFPRIISRGRTWFSGMQPLTDKANQAVATSSSATTIVATTDDDENEDEERASLKASNDTLPTSPRDFPAAEGLEVPQEPLLSAHVSQQPGYGGTTDTAGEVADADQEEDWGIEFDLFFVRWSLVVDSLVTFFAGFSSESWHVYLAGFVLPFASGSAPASKGLLSELCPPEQRGDALSGITLVESMATLLTQGLFGVIFAAMSEIDQPRLTFFCNAGFAVLGFVVLFMARLPPAGSRRIDDRDPNAEQDGVDPRLRCPADSQRAGQ
ncbi:major facilitator superfamily domain-containing protein [Microdochium bolleyi]|uniref:Major facilitator superfamily domain-containing protein n=1 Tax=Microdochium bolleyi TaxID=196109 RepID=A0A136J4I8_9PEZI|nr:major facilitator superfamily domain-containing protein [Microdochium bolleyi]